MIADTDQKKIKEIEEKTKIPIICPKKRFAIEKSKVEQRLLLSKIVPETNPVFKIFDPQDYKNKKNITESVKNWVNELGGVDSIVIKPDKPGFGKGVGVGGEHFQTIEEAGDHFLSLFGGLSSNKVIIEEKVDGEESSLQTWCDGKTLKTMPETRDHKRAFDGDVGPNTGGMGAYRDVKEYLPFMSKKDYDTEKEIATKI